MTEIWLITRRTSTLFLIFTSVIFTYPLESSGFQLAPSKMKYEEAKSYCRKIHTDLAKVYNLAEVNTMILSVLPTANSVWIGLELGELWIWHWTGFDQGTTFFNWRTGEPQKSNKEAQDMCAAMDQNGTWVENDCETQESFVCQASGNASSHIFIEVKKSWRDARNHCLNLSSDLVTILSAEENKAIRNMSTSERLWIGLFKDPWTWSDGSNSSFRFWSASEPSYNGGNNRGCVTASLENDGKWSTENCNNKHNFICGEATNQATTSSQTIHQSITTDRPSTNKSTPSHNSSQGGSAVFNSTLVPTEHKITNVTTTTPSTIPQLTVLNTTEVVSHNISILPNRTKMPTTPITPVTNPALSTVTGPTTSTHTEVVSHPITTEFNNTGTETPAMILMTPPQNITTSAPSTVTGPTTFNTTEVGLHPITTTLNNTSTEMPTMTPAQLTQNNTTPAPTTTTGPTTSNTTEVVSHPITTELNTTSTERPTMISTPPPQNVTTPAPLAVTGPTTFNTTEVGSHLTIPELNSTEITPTQKPQNTTVRVTTSSVFTSTAQVGTSVQTATRSPTPISTVSSLYSEDRLILIQKNMTWIAALSFCREHYIDLVQITNENIQDQVADRVKSSTSPYVWLGLRYTCNFTFWFWTSSTAGCYQNWRPGEGPERANECGDSGAIEATGRQQWVGLPETRELNFICQTCGG